MKPNTLKKCHTHIDELESRLEHHPAARANRIVHLCAFAVGVIVFASTALLPVLRAIGLGEHADLHWQDITMQFLIGTLLIAPEMLGKAAARDAFRAFAGAFGSALGKVAGKGLSVFKKKSEGES